jgi:Ala-tRNA(Pro) deacylase
MPLLACLAAVLSRERMPYVVFHHQPAYTAQEQAAASHIQGHSAVKVVICIADDGGAVQAVVPSHYLVDLERLRVIAGASALRLATEEEIAALYPQFEVGAAPPFGTIYGHRVFFEQCFVGEPEMVFNAGTHTESVCMHYGDLAELVKPVVATFGVPPSRPAKAPTVRKFRPASRGGASVASV